MKRFWTFLTLLVLASFVLTACAQPAIQATSTPSLPPDTAKTEPSATPPPTATSTATPKPSTMSGPVATAMALQRQVTLSAPTAEVIDPHDYVGIFEQAWRIVNENYLRDNYNGVDWDAVHDEYLPRAQAVTNDEEMDELLSDLIHELGDDHSRYVPKNRMGDEFGVGQSSRGYPSTGIDLHYWPARENQYVYVWYVCSESPAARAGIERGDIVLAINGEPFELTGPGEFDPPAWRVAFGYLDGKPITLTVQSGPDEEPREVKLSLSGVGGCDDWRHELVSESPRIGYIRVPNFEGDADVRILDALRDMEKDAPLDGVIVDVRHNPGGNSDKAMQIFAQGIIGTMGSLREGATRTIYRIRGPVRWNETTPMVVLTDGSSHSAAEYFAIGMQVLGRATIIGENTAGNTEGINSFNLANGTVIRLAVTTILLEDGSSLEGVGVTPDVKVPLGEWGLRQRPYDVQLQAGIDYLIEHMP